MSRRSTSNNIEAVASPPGRALVIAGAGSGKTRTLTYRVAWLLDHGVDPRELLLLTFTNKAAREMTERVRELVPHDTSALWAGTFHSIGSRILRRHAEDLGFTRSYSILDRDDQKSMLNAVIAGCDIDTKQRRFPKADVLAAIFSLIENTGCPLDEIIAARHDHCYEWTAQIEQVRAGYIARKLATNSLDFDDLLVMTVRLFEQRPDVLAIYRQRFHHILVDEYQDTNAVQGRMIDLLAGDSNNLMVVGDDAQSIYSWRGADMALILGFPAALSGRQGLHHRDQLPQCAGDPRAVQRRDPRQHRPLRKRPALVARGVRHQTRAGRLAGPQLAGRVCRPAHPGAARNGCSVRWRWRCSIGRISRVWKSRLELTMRGIPFAITSGLRFFEQAHIKDVAAFMRFVVNRRDEVSFLRMVGLLPGCGPATASKLWSEWLKSGWAERATPPPSWSEILLRFKVPKKSAKHWEQLCYTLDELTPAGGFASPSAMIFSILEGVYGDYLEASFDNADSRRGDIERLSEYGGNFDDILDFLEQLSLMSTTDGEPGAGRAAPDEDKVTLSSIHQAKGLEWTVVFLIWLVDGQFPNGRVLETEDLDLLEEERRLFYVALTRAKDELYLTYPMTNPKSYSGDVICRPSSFLDDFPPALVEEWDVGGADPWGEEQPF